MAIDWSLNRVPDIAGGTMAGYERGREQSRLRVRNAALAQYGEDPNAGLRALRPVDPELAIQLQGQAAEAQRAIGREDEATQARHRQRALGFFTGLLQYNDPQALGAAAEEALAQNLSDLGPEELARIRQTLSTTPLTPDIVRRAVVNLGGTLPRPQIINGRNGSYTVADPTTGNPLTRYDAPPEPVSAVDQARINYYNAGVGLRGAQTERARRPPAGNNGRGASGGGRRRRRGGGGSGGGGSTSTGGGSAPWDRDY